MKKIITACLLLAAVLCAALAAAGRLTTVRRDTAMADEQRYTESQLNILKGFGFSDTLINSGYLSPGMTKLLAGADETLAWLTARYPGQTMVIVRAAPGSAGDEAAFVVRCGDEEFEARRLNTDSGAVYSETYWNRVHRKQLNEWAEALLLPLCPGVHAWLEGADLYDDSVSGDAEVAALLAAGRRMTVSGRLFVPEGTDPQPLADCLKKAGLRGLVTVLSYDGLFDLGTIPEYPSYKSLGLTACVNLRLADEGGNTDAAEP